jgi:hypothetical protein
VENLLEAGVGEFVVVRAFAPEAFTYQATCTWDGFEGQRRVARYDVEVVAGWNALTSRSGSTKVLISAAQTAANVTATRIALAYLTAGDE